MIQLPGTIRTPKTISLTIAAGGYYNWDVEGHELRILSLSGVTTIRFAFNDDAWQTCYPQVGYPVAPGLQFERVRFYNDGGSSATFVAVCSDSSLASEASNLATLLSSINSRLAATSSIFPLSRTNVAATGSAATIIFSAVTTRKLASITAAESNTGYVYIGNSPSLSASVYCMAVLLPGGTWSDDKFTGAIRAVGNDGNQYAHGYYLY